MKKVSFTPSAGKRIVKAVQTIESLSPTIRNTRTQYGASDVVIYVAKLSGAGPVYDGTEQKYNGTSWVDAFDPVVWSSGAEIGQITEINGVSGLADRLVLVTMADGDDDAIWVCQHEETAGEASFRAYIDGTSGNLRFHDGDVWIEDNTAITVSDDGTGYNPATQQDYWVETTTVFGATTTTVDTEIQAGSLSKALEETPAGTLVSRTPIFTVDSGGFIMKHEGDIWYDSLFSPSFSADYRETDENNGKYMGIKSATGNAGTGFTYFLQGIEFQSKFLAGEMIDVTESNEFSFGGTDEDDSIDYTDEIDTDTADQITFGRSSLDFTINSGLTEKLETGSATDFVMEALKWIGIEVGGNLVHNTSPVDSTSHADHWVKLTIPNVQINDGTAASIDLYFDRTGHLWQYNSTTQPPPGDNYRYEHCSDPSTYPDLIFSSQQANTVILVDDQCYEEQGETDADATDPAPTVSNTYSTCSACTGALVNEQWKKCEDDTNAAVLSAAHTDVDYAWLCIGGVLVKCYFDANTATVATDPTVLKQCGDPVPVPTQCADLVGWPASDDFGGSGCDSGSVGDTNWEFRWTTLVYDAGTVSIVGSRLFIDNEDPGTEVTGIQGKVTIPSNANFEYHVYWEDVSFGAGTQAQDFQTSIFTPTRYDITRLRNGGANTFTWPGGNETTSATTFKFSFVRVGTGSNNISVKINDVEKTTFSSNAAITLWNRVTSNPDSGNSGYIDNIVVESDGDDVLIDITGESCT